MYHSQFIHMAMSRWVLGMKGVISSKNKLISVAVLRIPHFKKKKKENLQQVSVASWGILVKIDVCKSFYPQQTSLPLQVQKTWSCCTSNVHRLNLNVDTHHQGRVCSNPHPAREFTRKNLDGENWEPFNPFEARATRYIFQISVLMIHMKNVSMKICY